MELHLSHWGFLLHVCEQKVGGALFILTIREAPRKCSETKYLSSEDLHSLEGISFVCKTGFYVFCEN